MPTPAMIWLNITHTPRCQKVNRGRQGDIWGFRARMSAILPLNADATVPNCWKSHVLLTIDRLTIHSLVGGSRPEEVRYRTASECRTCKRLFRVSDYLTSLAAMIETFRWHPTALLIPKRIKTQIAYRLIRQKSYIFWHLLTIKCRARALALQR